MANLITYSDFSGLLTLPDAGDATVNQKCTDLITEFQNQILDDLMGYSLRKAFLADVAAVTPQNKWLLLLNGGEYTNDNGDLTYFQGVKKMLVYYIYAEIIRYYAFLTTQGSGEAQGKSNNATVEFDKFYRYYNMFIEEYRNCHDYLLYKYNNDADFANLTNLEKYFTNKFGI